MKVIQILDELSERTISLVRVVQIINNYKFINKKSQIVSTKNKINLKNIKIFDTKIGNFFFFSSVYKFLKIKKPDVIHVHGLWRPIHLLFILKSAVLNIPIIIQPHGMLLDQALKSKSIINYILKFITLKIYKLLLYKKKIVFIAVTLEEKYSILKFFSKSKVYIINNPFEISTLNNYKIKKLFVYFGRYNPHKNLKEFITAFIKADLGKEWVLNIYGINDNNDYKEELINLVKKNNYIDKIKFLLPEYNLTKKNKILNQAWCNVLISKSEVLSLSVLEALSLGTKSLVNKKIFFPKWIKKNNYSSHIDETTLTKSIKFLTSQSLKEKKKEKKEIRKIFRKKYILKNIENNYKICIKKIITSNDDNKKKNRYYASFISNVLNSFLISYLIVLSVLTSNNSFAAEVGLVPGMFVLVSQIFSANSRSLIIYNRQLLFFDQIISFRIILGLIIILFTMLGSYILGFGLNLALFLTCIAAYLSWIIEIIISFNEKNKFFFAINIFIIANTFFYFTLFFIYFFFSINELSVIFLILIIFQTLYIVYFLPKNIFKINNIFFNFFKLIYKPLPLISSFSNIIAAIIWRLSLIFLMGKEIAGIFFASFAVASFPGTLFNNIIGQILLTSNNLIIYLKKRIKIILSLYYLVLFSFYFYLNNMEHFENFTFFKYALISLLGTPIMLLGFFYRHLSLSKSLTHQNVIFIKDSFFGIIISPIILITYYLGGENYVAYAYILSSVIALFIFKTFLK